MKKQIAIAVLSACMLAGGAVLAPSAVPGTALETQAAENENVYFTCLNAQDVDIRDTGTYTIVLKAKEGWQFDVADNADVTRWIVNENGAPAFTNDTGVAFAKNGDDFTLTITIDASKIEGFTTNGSGTLYVRPTGGIPLIVEGDNHGQYTVVSEKAGTYTIPKVSIEGTVEATSSKSVLTYSNQTVQVHLDMDGLEDDRIDSSAAKVRMIPGDGYYLSDYGFEEDALSGTWKDGTLSYTVRPDQLTGDFSELGGDGNGNYIINIGVDGLTYNGLPLSGAAFRIHVYAYGRTFSIESNGSLIDATQPLWTTTSKDGIPVLCDPYPDDLLITWPIDFDASKLTEDDVTLTMRSEYGDELVLKPGTDYSLSTSQYKTVLTVTYLYWPSTPVYTTLTVDVNIADLSYDAQKYTPGSTLSHTYDIASVYAYYVMHGGMQGTQQWTYYGVDGLTEWSQAFAIPTYTLTYTDASGTVLYYTEDADGNGRFTTDADAAKKFDSMADNNCRVEGNTGSFDRVYNQTAEVTVDGTTYTCSKVYCNADDMPLDPADCTGLTAKPGYVIGDSWEMHGRWPWQTFVNVGYQGGTK
ncbi:MAG: hypothetical protein ACI4OJ_02980 [Lachnospiraceae bacterium]